MIWTYSRRATNSICLCGDHSANRQMLSVWSWYFKENYVRNAGVHLTKTYIQTKFWGSGFEKLWILFEDRSIRFFNMKIPQSVLCSKKNPCLVMVKSSSFNPQRARRTKTRKKLGTYYYFMLPLERLDCIVLREIFVFSWNLFFWTKYTSELVTSYI